MIYLKNLQIVIYIDNRYGKLLKEKKHATRAQLMRHGLSCDMDVFWVSLSTLLSLL